MGMLLWYAVPFALAYGTAHPWLALLAIVVFLARKRLPNPVVWMRTIEHASRLERDVAANPANAVARRDLARLYLDRGFAKRALRFLTEARTRFPDDEELLFLVGKATFALGNAEQALGYLIKCVANNPTLLHGEPYGIATKALLQAKRYDEAVDAAERFVAQNGSALEPYRLLAYAQRRAGDNSAALRTEQEARATWRALPKYKRRGQWPERVRLALGV
jgi:tetratricopeptide (TPR) repeat protein